MSGSVRIKICGIRSSDEGRAAVDAGAEEVGQAEHEVLDVVEVVGNRARIVAPFKGWVSARLAAHLGAHDVLLG